MSIAERFFNRFMGLIRAHGTYVIKEQDARGKVQGKASSVKSKVTISKWDDHLSGIMGIGIVPVNDKGQCWFGAIDVDVYDLNLEYLEKRISKLKLPLIVCRTKSGGAHLFLFIKGSCQASIVRDKLMEWSVDVGHPNVEVFPKQSEIASEDDIGSWLNMPYFEGDSTTRYAIKKGNALTTEEFLKYAEEKEVTEEELLEIKSKQDPKLEGAPPCLQHLCQAGFPEGTRNNGLYNLGVFCKLKFGDDWLDYAKEMNKDYLIPPLPDQEATGTLNQLQKKNYFYKCKEPPILNACNKSICGKREFGIKKSAHDPGIILDGLVKILTDPPMWFINIDGKRIKLDSSEDLLSQRKFERLCVDAHNVVPNRIPENAWRDMLRDLMDKVEEVEAPEDAGSTGQFLIYLRKFCLERVTSENPKEILLEKVYVKSGRMYFQSTHMLAFMDRQRFKITPKRAWSILRDIGGDVKRFRVGNIMIRTWHIPAYKQGNIKITGKEIDDNEELF